MASPALVMKAVDEPLDPEEGALGLLTATRAAEMGNEPEEEELQSSRSKIQSRAFWTMLILSTAGLLLFILCTHFPGRGSPVADAAIDEAHSKQELLMAPRTCPGTLPIAGLGQAALVNTKPDETVHSSGDQIEVQGASIIANMNGRAYFGDQCVESTYSASQYMSVPLLGNTLKYTIDMSGAGCGCNAAVYLASMKQNMDIGSCGDYYCDANSVCGVSCTELDIQEANMFAWRSTLHTSDDRGGQGFGYGGTGDLQSSWQDGQYGPGGSCIDTTRPFQVAVSFPTNADNTLHSMQVTLSQAGSPCPLSGAVSTYQVNGRDGMQEVTQALRQGMTPVISFWSADSMTWLDGKGDKGGACTNDVASQCPDSVRVYGFSYEQGATINQAAETPVTVPQAASSAIMTMPAEEGLDWAVFPGKDTFAFSNVHEMDAADINACKQYAQYNTIEAFVVWQGVCYFRAQSGPACRANLDDSSEATAYILRSSLGASSSASSDMTSAGWGTSATAANVAGGATGVPGWFQATDATGVTYYYNKDTQETSWTLPLQ